MKHIISLKKSARYWDDGLPLGNGRLGAMIMGKVDEETIIINEETLWFGPDRNRKNPDSKENLEKIRELLLQGEVPKAQFLAKMAFTSTPKYVNPYQPAGDLRLCFYDHKDLVDDYHCYLDIDNALAHVSYNMRGVAYGREHFVNRTYNVFVTKLSSSIKGNLTLSVNMSRKPFEEYTEKLDDKTVCNYGENGVGGVNYFTGVRLSANGGEIHTMGDFVYVQGADEVYIYVSCGTDFQGENNFREDCIQRLDQAESLGYEFLKEDHLRSFHTYYDRVDLQLYQGKEEISPIEDQLKCLQNGEEHNSLVELLFHYARYLMICCSLDCKLPANLQGIWNGEYVPPWQSEYTININFQMNYWMVEKCNLPECTEPVFALIDRIVENGRKTAKEIYGCGGFCAHHNTNIWANTDIEGIFDASPIWPMGGAWLSLHMYEHYLYIEDKKFLKEQALRVMGEAIEFFKDYLYEMEDGTLITGPSVSPENTYLSKVGKKGALCMGPAMDIQILRQLFTWYIEGYRLVYEEDDKLLEVESMLNRLPQTKISLDGRIMEWQEDYTEVEPGHRHISHLYALHPGNEIVEDKKELFKAAEKTLEYRLSHGGGHTGWSRAWIICFYARLKKAEKVIENIYGLLEKSIKINLLDTHPPFQIDGNFGVAEGILEALVQSHNTYIEVLPALPKDWNNGKLKGVRLRGALTCNIYWSNGRLDCFEVTADTNKTVTFKYKDQMIESVLQSGTLIKIPFRVEE